MQLLLYTSGHCSLLISQSEGQEGVLHPARLYLPTTPYELQSHAASPRNKTEPARQAGRKAGPHTGGRPPTARLRAAKPHAVVSFSLSSFPPAFHSLCLASPSSLSSAYSTPIPHAAVLHRARLGKMKRARTARSLIL